VKTLDQLATRELKAEVDLAGADNDENAIVIRRATEVKKITDEINKALA
jgi:hypothetical protein